MRGSKVATFDVIHRFNELQIAIPEAISKLADLSLATVELGTEVDGEFNPAGLYAIQILLNKKPWRVIQSEVSPLIGKKAISSNRAEVEETRSQQLKHLDGCLKENNKLVVVHHGLLKSIHVPFTCVADEP